MTYQKFLEHHQKKPVVVYQDINEKRPLVSVCVQTYQHFHYIRSCLDSIIMQQANFPFEILIIDDDSTDGTREICQEYAIKQPNCIRLFLNHRENNIKINGQETGRFNFLYNLYNARGKYISICEGDDYWIDSLKLQKQVDFLENNNDYVLCFHACQTLKTINRKEIKTNQLLSGINYEYTFQNLLSFWNIPTASLMLKRDVKFVFPDWFLKVASGDIALVMLYFEKGKFKFLEEYMSIYRLTNKGVSKSHVNYRMIHYRAVLYTYLNEYYEYKYEKEIMDALNYIYEVYSGKNRLDKKNSGLFYRLKKRFN